jgi:hypothetical protein
MGCPTLRFSVRRVECCTVSPGMGCQCSEYGANASGGTAFESSATASAMTETLQRVFGSFTVAVTR